MNKKIAIVTGNKKGLGERITARLAELGYVQPRLVTRESFDLRQPENCKKLVDLTIQEYGRIDLLVNCVGDYLCESISDLDPEKWLEMMDSNLNSAYFICHYALPYLRKAKTPETQNKTHPSMQAMNGRIINIGFAGLEKLDPKPNVAAYEVAKTGLLLLTKALAKSEAPNRVLVNMLSPGHMENTVDNSSIAKIRLGRTATLDEAFEIIKLFIESNYITGQNIELAGAWGL